MNLLIITPYIPYPLHSGGNRAQFDMINGLKGYVSISLLVRASNPTDRQNIEILKTKWPEVTFFVYDPVQKIAATKHSRYYKLLYALRASLDRKIARLLRQNNVSDPIRQHATLSTRHCKHWEESFIDYIFHTAQKDFDIIQVEFFDMIDLIHALPENVIKIFMHHEIRFVRQEIELSLLQQITPADRYFYRCFRDYEIACLRNYDSILTFSETDKQKLKQYIPKVPVFSSPSTGIIPQFVSIDFEPSHEIVFLGGVNHFPNKDGLDWFLSQCWSLVREKNRDVKLYITGEWKKSIVEKYLSMYPSIYFSGFVEDLSCALRNRIMIVPIRIGSGMRIKILDGVVNGCPLVTTTVGVEGIDLIHKEDCLIADDPESFADAVVYLLDNPETCRKMVANAQKKIEQYSSDRQVKERLNIYHQILSNAINRE